MQCAFCPRACSESYPYRFGAVRGYLCRRCARSLEGALTRWANDHADLIARENERKSDQRKLAKADIELELHPRTFRSAG